MEDVLDIMSSLSSISFFLSEELIIWRAGFTIGFDTRMRNQAVTKLYIAYKTYTDDYVLQGFHHK